MKNWILIIFNLAYIIPFSLYYIYIKNFEFLWYVLILVILFVILIFSQKKLEFSQWVLWGFSIWGLLHMMGGGLRIDGDVLYALELIPIWVTENFYVLKYDQFVHGYIYFIIVFALWHLAKRYIKKDSPKALMITGVALASMGIGALNEFAEFLPVLFLEYTGVGGYYNTAWDIVFNSLGAFIASLIIYFKR